MPPVTISKRLEYRSPAYCRATSRLGVADEGLQERAFKGVSGIRMPERSGVGKRPSEGEGGH